MRQNGFEAQENKCLIEKANRFEIGSINRSIQWLELF